MNLIRAHLHEKTIIHKKAIAFASKDKHSDTLLLIFSLFLFSTGSEIRFTLCHF